MSQADAGGSLPFGGNTREEEVMQESEKEQPVGTKKTWAEWVVDHRKQVVVEGRSGVSNAFKKPVTKCLDSQMLCWTSGSAL